MTRYCRWLLAGVMVCSGFATSSVADTIRLAIGEWAPYTSERDASGKMAERIVEEALKRQGHTVEYTYFPWVRSYEMVKQGHYDGTFPWYMTPERQVGFWVHATPVMREKEVFFYLKTLDFHWQTIEDLKAYRVGGTIGYSHVDTMEAAGVRVEKVVSEEQNFRKLLVDRIDIYPASFLVGYNMIHKLFGAEKAQLFTNHPKPLRNDAMFALFSKRTEKGKEYADALEEGLKALLESGEYDALVEAFLIRNKENGHAP